MFAFLLGILISAYLFLFIFRKDGTASPGHTPMPYQINRLTTFKNIRPIISVEPKEESENLQETKLALTNLIDSLKQVGNLTAASVYLRKTSTSEWIAVNDTVRYHPASMMKVPLMLAWLKIAEANPGTLEKQLDYKIDDTKLPKNPQYKAQSIEAGKSYTVHDLIFYMIAHSDNRAAQALQQNADSRYAVMLLKELGLPSTQNGSDSYMLTAGEYSMFIKAIYNSTFNSPEYSQYASEMMENSSFKKGFAEGFPTGTQMWHKFGEWASPGQPDELHQSGVVVLGNEPYILTIMTRGKGYDNLEKVLAMICNRVFSSTVKFT